MKNVKINAITVAISEVAGVLSISKIVGEDAGKNIYSEIALVKCDSVKDFNEIVAGQATISIDDAGNIVNRKGDIMVPAFDMGAAAAVVVENVKENAIMENIKENKEVVEEIVEEEIAMDKKVTFVIAENKQVAMMAAEDIIAGFKAGVREFDYIYDRNGGYGEIMKDFTASVINVMKGKGCKFSLIADVKAEKKTVPAKVAAKKAPTKKVAAKGQAFYAVAIGRAIGVFTDWKLMSNSIDRFDGRCFRKCFSEADAKAFVKKNALPADVQAKVVELNSQPVSAARAKAVYAAIHGEKTVEVKSVSIKVSDENLKETMDNMRKEYKGGARKFNLDVDFGKVLTEDMDAFFRGFLAKVRKAAVVEVADAGQARVRYMEAKMARAANE